MPKIIVEERKRVLDRFKSTKYFKSLLAPEANRTQTTPKSVTISAPDMAESRLGLNDRIVFNRSLIHSLSGKLECERGSQDRDGVDQRFLAKKLRKVFMKPKLEGEEERVLKRIRVQNGLVKKVEAATYESSDEDEEIDKKREAPQT